MSIWYVWTLNLVYIPSLTTGNILKHSSNLIQANKTKLPNISMCISSAKRNITNQRV